MELVEDTALKSLKKMVRQAKSSRSFLQMKVYPLYIKAQMKRWMTQNTSQGSEWEPLNPKYAQYKLTRFATGPGGGRKMMIATGDLYKSIIGAGDGHFKMITENEMIVGTSISYAKYAGGARPIMQFDKEFIKMIKADWIKWILSGKGKS